MRRGDIGVTCPLMPEGLVSSHEDLVSFMGASVVGCVLEYLEGSGEPLEGGWGMCV